IRAMPNLGAAARRSMTALAAGTHATDLHRQMAEEIFRAVGDAAWVEEKQMDAVTAVSGSGPAYFALLTEAMAAAGINQGLEPAVAARLAVETLHGTGAVLADSDMTPEEFRKKVTSPGGTTEAAVAELEHGGFRDLVAAAVEAARLRSEQLSR
ncbi:MAG: pyrroline-5-carboxylate reductase family protein, partial [Actinomycetota bacterium]